MINMRIFIGRVISISLLKHFRPTYTIAARGVVILRLRDNAPATLYSRGHSSLLNRVVEVGVAVLGGKLGAIVEVVHFSAIALSADGGA